MKFDKGWQQNPRFSTERGIFGFYNPHICVYGLKKEICPPDKIPEEYSELAEKSKMERFAKTHDCFQPLTIFAKCSMFEV